MPGLVPDKTVLLHICCAGCATESVRRLSDEGFRVTGFFYNPNIHPEKEYQKRKQDLNIIRKEFSIDIIEGEYHPDKWFEFIKGHENDREGGQRCGLCFEMRLKEAYRAMIDRGFDFFTTTLTISPHKNSGIINNIGKEIGGDRFLSRDFKKKDGFKKSVIVSKELGLYRQNYCGCVYSMRTDRQKAEDPV